MRTQIKQKVRRQSRYLMQTWLSIEQHHIPVDDMPLNRIAYSQVLGNKRSVPEPQELLDPITPRCYVICTRVHIAAIPNRLT